MAAVMERFKDRFIGVLVIHVFADDADNDFSFGMENGVEHLFPTGKIRFAAVVS